MRHSKHKFKLGVNPSHRKSLIKNLCIELIDHGKIKTTITKSRAIQGKFEKLITLAKNDTLANRRLAFRKLNNKNAVNTLFVTVAPKFKERNGGYTRIIKLADQRVGDASKMSIISLVE